MVNETRSVSDPHPSRTELRGGRAHACYGMRSNKHDVAILSLVHDDFNQAIRYSKEATDLEGVSSWIEKIATSCRRLEFHRQEGAGTPRKQAILW